MKTGIEPKYTIIVKLADPSVDGQERVSFNSVAFDDFTIMDLEILFTFVDYTYLDTIE